VVIDLMESWAEFSCQRFVLDDPDRYEDGLKLPRTIGIQLYMHQHSPLLRHEGTEHESWREMLFPQPPCSAKS